MKSIANIIAATDFSQCARLAIDRAVMLSDLLQENLRLIHVRDLGVLESIRRMMGDARASSIDQVDNRLMKELEDYLAVRHPRALQIPRLRLVSGQVVQTILSEADAQIADLVVVGAQGESQMLHSPVGSIASRLLRKSQSYPVLLVKQVPECHYRRIIIAIDFSPVSYSLVRMAKRIAPDAELILLHAFELPYEEKLSIAGLNRDDINHMIREEGICRRHLLQRFIQDSGMEALPISARVVHGAPARVIVDASKEKECDLVIVGKHGSSAIEEFFIGSVTKHLLSELKHDILVMTDKRPPPELL